MVAAAVRRAIAARVAGPQWRGIANRALAATLRTVSPDGTLLPLLDALEAAR